MVLFCFKTLYPNNSTIQQKKSRKDTIIQKADNGSIVVILVKESYIQKMKELLTLVNLSVLKFHQTNIWILQLILRTKLKTFLKAFLIKRILLICYIRKFRLLDAALGFYMAKRRNTNLSLTIFHLLGQYLTLLTHHR